MPEYIKYNRKIQEFEATGKRPGNQNGFAILNKIAERLERYTHENKNVKMTPLQSKFITLVSEQKRFLLKEKIDVAHHIAISKIIEVLVTIMNSPEASELNNFHKFGDEMLSTEEADDDKGRSDLEHFLQDIFEGNLTPKELCAEANKIIAKLNCCSRNLIPGYSSVNRSISDNKDLHLIYIKKNRTFISTPPSIKIGRAFSHLPDCDNYRPKSQFLGNKKTFFSSSVSANKEESCVYEVTKSTFKKA